MASLPTTHALVTETLCRRDARLAYPLMREAVPGLTLPAWLAFARRRIGASDDKRGIIVARREGVPHFLGAVCYERSDNVRLGPILRAEHFVAIDLLSPQKVLLALVSGLDVMATRLGCTMIRSVDDAGWPGLKDGLQTCGLVLDGFVFSRRTISG